MQSLYKVYGEVAKLFLSKIIKQRPKIRHCVIYHYLVFQINPNLNLDY